MSDAHIHWKNKWKPMNYARHRLHYISYSSFQITFICFSAVSSIEEYRSVDDTLDQPIYTAHHSHSPNYLGSDGRQIQASECDTYRGIDGQLSCVTAS